MTSRRILVATRNRGKLRELIPIFARAGYDPVTLQDIALAEIADEETLEQFETFEENALAKARYFARMTGMDVIADDSGLVVDALGGAPGVHSKRWSGCTDPDTAVVEAANRRMLLAALEGSASRRSHFVCAAAMVRMGEEVVVRGEAHGVILAGERGEGGFGYDSLFLSDDLGCTLAEASIEAKEGVSARGLAFADLVRKLKESGSGC